MEIDYAASATLAKVVYQAFDAGKTLTKAYLKQKLKDWVLDEGTFEELARRVSQMGIEDSSERKIRERLEKDETIQSCLHNLSFSQSIGSVQQTHSGVGDNVAGNKTEVGKLK